MTPFVTVTVITVVTGVVFVLYKSTRSYFLHSDERKPNVTSAQLQGVSENLEIRVKGKKAVRLSKTKLPKRLQRKRFVPKLDCAIIASYGGHVPPGAVGKRQIIPLFVSPKPTSRLRGVNQDLNKIQDMIRDDDFKQLVHVCPQVDDIHMDVNGTKQFIKERMETAQEKSTNNGLLLWYTGHGETLTGNWPFKDGCLTFTDIYNLYKRHMKGKHLYVVCDCCYSGNWVKDCARCLDADKVCNSDHDQTYLKVFASSLPDQKAVDPLYTVGGGVTMFTHDKSSHVIGFAKHRPLIETMEHSQTTLGYDFTLGSVTQKDESVAPNSTWEQRVDYLMKAQPNGAYIC